MEKTLESVTKKLIKLGTKNGTISLSDFTKTIGDLEITQEQVEDLYKKLDEEGITISTEVVVKEEKKSSKSKQVHEVKTLDERKQELIEEGKKKGYITF